MDEVKMDSDEDILMKMSRVMLICLRFIRTIFQLKRVTGTFCYGALIERKELTSRSSAQ